MSSLPPPDPADRLDVESTALTSRSWRRSRSRARDYLDGDRDLGELVDRASTKADRSDLGKVGKIVDELKSLIRLIRAYASGEYREVRVDHLILIIAGIVYFVSPMDLLPDVLGPLGFGDDGIVLAYVLRVVAEELEAFRLWEGTA